MSSPTGRLGWLTCGSTGVRTRCRLQSGTAEAPAAAAHPVLPLNAGVHAGRTEFDAAMPAGTYSDIELQIEGQNFQAKVEVSGSQAPGSSDARRIGTYTIFDLTRERSGRNTVLHLPASDFRYLHFAVDGPILPEAVTGITVLPAADTPEPVYTAVAQTTIAVHQGRSTTLTLKVPARVPVDRVLFQPGAEPRQFSRRVTVKATAAQPSQDEDEGTLQLTFTGTLLRLQDTRDGQTFHAENSSINTAARASDADRTWTVTVDDGDDHPLQLGAVQLQMLQRELCFELAGPGAYVLRYGDPALAAPQYDYALRDVQKGRCRSDTWARAAECRVGTAARCSRVHRAASAAVVGGADCRGVAAGSWWRCVRVPGRPDGPECGDAGPRRQNELFACFARRPAAC